MTTPSLSVTDTTGQRIVPIDKPVFTIGRRSAADLQIIGRDVSRDHAQIVREGDRYLISDCGSRFGTFVNDDAVRAPRVLSDGDRIRLGTSDFANLVFSSSSSERAT